MGYILMYRWSKTLIVVFNEPPRQDESTVNQSSMLTAANRSKSSGIFNQLCS